MKRSLWSIIIFILSASVMGVAYWWFLHSEYFAVATVWVAQYRTLFFISLIVTKIAGVVWPPIPGGLLTLGAIPILGWRTAYIADLIGSVMGSTIAYYIGKKYGKRLLMTFLDETTIEKILRIQIKPKREIESVFLLRIFGGATVTEIVCYAAGILRIRWWQFFIGTTASHVVWGVPLYYFATSFFDRRHMVVSLILVLFAASFFVVFKKRYLNEPAA